MKKKTVSSISIIFNLLDKKTEFIPSSEMKCPKSGIFADNYWVGESGKATLPVSPAFFPGAVEIFCGQRWFSPLRKNCPVRLCDPTRSLSFLKQYLDQKTVVA